MFNCHLLLNHLLPTTYFMQECSPGVSSGMSALPLLICGTVMLNSITYHIFNFLVFVATRTHIPLPHASPGPADGRQCGQGREQGRPRHGARDAGHAHTGGSGHQNHVQGVWHVGWCWC